MATIKDVAALAGVSYTTVSHVINNSRPVSDRARSEVEAAIRTLSYVPSAIARSLKHRATSTIGLLISNSTNPFFSELARGIEDACYQNGYSVILCNSDDDPKRQQTYLRVLLERRIDGLIISSTGEDRNLANQLSNIGIPFVVVDRPIPGLKANLVQIDHLKGGYLATKYLVGLGHRLIGCIAGPYSAAVSLERVEGYRRALKKAGIPYTANYVVESDFTCEGGYRAGSKLLKNRDLTAVFASNDLMAIGLLRLTRELGLAVPRQLSIVGFDDIELCRYVHPALTTVGHSIQHQGELTARTLIELINRGGNAKVRRIALAPTLVVRDSAEPWRNPASERG
jgi:LacI family transcriptional regulator, galactose operon repressor